MTSAIAGLIPVLFIGLMVLAIVACRARGDTLLRRWAEANSLQILEAKPSVFFRGPFTFRSGKDNAIYRIRVMDPAGRVHTGWARCGGLFLGMWWSDSVTVEWDRE